MFQDLPLHPLLVHFAIVLLLLTAGGQLLAVVLPRFRRWFGWGMPLLGVVSAVIGRVAQSFGEVLAESGTITETAALQEHEEWGEQAGLAGIVLGVVTVLYWVATSEWGRARWAGRWPGWVGLVLGVLAAGVSIWVIVAVTLAGHSGATSVWLG